MKTKTARRTPKAVNAVTEIMPSSPAECVTAPIPAAERMQAQEMLQKSEERYRLLFNSMTEGFAFHELIFDENGDPCDYRFLDINLAFEQMTGLKREDIIGKGQSEILPDEDPFWFRTYCEVALNGRTIHLEHFSPPLQRHFEVYAYCPAPNQFAVIFTNITERKRIEDALAASEAELRALFASMHDVVLVIDREGVYRKIAPTNPGLLYNPPEELLDKNLRDVFPAEKAELFREVMLHVLDTKQSTQIEYELFIGGRTVWFQTTISALNEDNTLWVAHDITNRKRADGELRRAKDALETINFELQVSLEREKLLSCIDGLTGLYNRSCFFKLAARELQAAMRHHLPLTFLMFDMDGFKQVNDTFGHGAGDLLLEKVAQVVTAQVRASDVVARYGGDEFIILLPNTDAQQAFPVTERIRTSVAGIQMKTDNDTFGVTLSIGIAETLLELRDENVERVIQRADQAMYQAKQGGRNRIVIYGQDETGAT